MPSSGAVTGGRGALVTAPALAVEGLTVGYGRAAPVLQSVTLTLPQGETLGLVGESGSGKTTLARAVVGLVAPTAGSIRVFGADIAALDRAGRALLRRRVQMVFQDPYTSLDPTMTVGEAVAEPLVVHGLGGRAERAAWVDELMRLVGLDASIAARFPAELSGGQRQRVAIARALAPAPALVICDEPVSALDVSVQAQILNLLKRLQRELGLSLLFVSHDLSVVRFLAQRIAVIEGGRIVEDGPRVAVLDRPQHPYTRALIEAARLRARPAGG